MRGSTSRPINYIGHPVEGTLAIDSSKSFHCLPFWYIFGSVALFGDVIVDESKLTSLSPGGDAVEADVELGAVLRVGVLGVGVQDASLQGLVGTLEPVDSHLVLCKIRNHITILVPSYDSILYQG